MNQEDNIYIVLVNYNGKKYIEECIKSIYRQTYKRITVVVVDNASSDGSLKDIEKYTDLIILRRKKNEGFAKGCNIGIQYALHEGADYVMLLNVDTVIDNDLVYELYQCADDHTITSPKIYDNDARTRIWYAGGDIDFQHGKHVQYHHRKLEKQHGKEHNYRVQFVSGCCMLVHRNVWKKVGFLDEKYFMYFDDDDLSVRFLKGKFQMRYVPAATMWHKVGGCFRGSKNSLTQYYFTRNRLYFVKKHSDIMKISVWKLVYEILVKQVIFPSEADKQYRGYVIKGVIDFCLGNMYQANCDFY